jgi:tape measure domain-containing protein
MADAQIRITADTTQAERALGGLQNTLKGLAAIAIGGSIVKSLVDIAGQSQELTNKLLSVSDNIGQANAKFSILAETAQKTGSNIGGTVDLFQKLAQSSTFAGSSTDALANIVENFNKTLQISGASGAGAASALYQFAQAMQKGTLNGDEFRNMQETNGFALKILAKELGVTQSQLRMMAEEGKLTADVIGKAFYKNQQITDAYGKTVRTIPQAFENLKTKVMESFRAFDEASGASDKLVLALEFLANNFDTIIKIAAAFFAAFAVGRIVAIAGAIMEIVAALRAMAVMEAIASGGLSLLLGAVAGTAAYVALDKAMEGVNKKHEEEKQKLKEIEAANGKGLVTTKPRSKQAEDLDKALKAQLLSMNAMSAIDEKNTGLRSLALEVERAIAAERVKYAATGDTMSKQQEKDLAAATRRKILAEELGNINKDLQSLQSSTLALNIQDANEYAVKVEMEKYRLSLTQESYDLRKNELELQIRANKAAEASRTILTEARNALANTQVQSNLDPRAQAVEAGVLQKRQQYGTAYTAELEAQHRILLQQNYDLDQQNQVRKTLNDLTRQQTELETAGRASSMFGNTKEGAAVDFGRQQDALKMLRDKGLIDEQSYLDQRVLMNQEAADKMLQYDQKIGEARLKQGGVTNQAIIDAVKMQQANVQMIQQGGIVGAQGVLGALDNVMSAMGANSRKAFEAHKALAIAQAVISTYQAAAMAIAFPPGPPLSFIYVAGAIAAGFAQINAIRSQQYSGKKVGGGVSGGQSYIVGENGPEMFTPASSGNITPNDKLSSGSNVTVNFQIVANDTTGFDQLLASRKGLITQIINDAVLEKGRRSIA